MIFQPIAPWPVLTLILAVALVSIIVIVARNWKTARSLSYSWIRRGFVLLICAGLLFRPGVGEFKETDVYTNSYDVFFVVDTTSSMVAEDWEAGTKATRLGAVKRDISQIVDEYTGARFSLIMFNKNTSVVTPLTKDATAVMSATENLKPELPRNSQGSQVRVAADLLEKTLKNNKETSPERATLVYFFSDGEETSTEKGDKDFTATQAFVDSGAVLGYGTVEGGRMLTNNGYYITNDNGYIQDPATGTDALSKIDEENLQAIAGELGVSYQHRVSDKPLDVDKKKDQRLTAEKQELLITNDYTWVFAVLLVLFIALEGSLVGLRLRETYPVNGKGGSS